MRSSPLARIEYGLHVYEFWAWTELDDAALGTDRLELDLELELERGLLQRIIRDGQGTGLRALPHIVGDRFALGGAHRLDDAIERLVAGRALAITKRPRPLILTEAQQLDVMFDYELAEQSGIRNWVGLSVKTRHRVWPGLSVDDRSKSWPTLSTKGPGYADETAPRSLLSVGDRVPRHLTDTTPLLGVRDQVPRHLTDKTPLLGVRDQVSSQTAGGGSLLGVDHRLASHLQSSTKSGTERSTTGLLSVGHELTPTASLAVESTPVSVELEVTK